MEILIVVGAIVIWFFWRQGRKAIDCQKLCFADFPVWLKIYIECPRSSADKATLAHTFIRQSINLASAMGALNHPDAAEISKNFHKIQPEECIRMADEWIETTLPTLSKVGGDQLLDTSQARLIGALMIVTLTSVIPDQGLQLFLQTKGVPKELTRVKQ